MSRNGFDDITSPRPAPSKESVNKNDNNNEGNDVNGFIRMISRLPCFPQREDAPPTPNIDQLKQIYDKFTKSDPNQTDTSVFQRSKSHELCQWTEKILAYLPSVKDAPEGAAQQNSVVSHFSLIKKFYLTLQNAGFDTSPEVDVFFNSLQIYECVMAIAFVVFQDHPETMKSIGEHVTKAISELENYSTQGCLTLTFCGLAILSRFNTILGAIDQKIGELGIVKVAEFIASILEVFCRFFNIDLRDADKITQISETIQDMVRSVTSSLKSVFGDSIPDVDRKKKWSPLSVTERLRTKLSKFEKESPIVERTVTSFEKFFSSVEKFDDDFENIKTTQRVSNATSSSNDQDLDMQRVENVPLLASQIADKQTSAFEQINSVGRFFQHLETILSYGILIFKNEDEVLNPLLDHVDECTRILEKFSALHPLYKILCGTNYLSKLKVVIKQIIQLLENSKLKINSPKEFIMELKQKYPDLLYLLCESFLNDKLKKKLEFLPDPLENALNDAMDGALSKFKTKFKF